MTVEERNRRRREHYAANREAIRQRQREYVAANAELVATRKAAYYRRNRDVIRERDRAKYEQSKAEILDRHREYRSRPEYAAVQAARLRQWYEDHPNARADYSQRRRARLLGVEVVERVTREAVWERDAGVCRICVAPVDPTSWHLDHIVPLAKGGLHVYNNLAVTHPSCNLAKSASDPREAGSPYAYLLPDPTG